MVVEWGLSVGLDFAGVLLLLLGVTVCFLGVTCGVGGFDFLVAIKIGLSLLLLLLSLSTTLISMFIGSVSSLESSARQSLVISCSLGGNQVKYLYRCPAGLTQAGACSMPHHLKWWYLRWE